ncbi:MAG: OpgC domain-containing protein [Pseudomonadota bacterium]
MSGSIHQLKPPPLDSSEFKARYGYPADVPGRDLRFDFMRGFAMLSVVAAHFEAFSWFNFIFWERLGIVSAAEMFVIASGLVLGLVNRRVVEKDGLDQASVRLLRRVFVLYRAQVVAILLVIFISWLKIIDVTAVTTFTDRFADVSYRLIPSEEASWATQLGLVLLLRVSPHQIQILSLYIVLLALTPFALWMLRRRLFGAYFTLSWMAYFAGVLGSADHIYLGMQFEYAFPLLIWQIFYFHALCIGFFKDEISERLKVATTRHFVLGVSFSLAFGFFIFAQTTPNPSFPTWSRLPLLNDDQFRAIYDTYFVKSRPGLPRLINVTVFFICLYAVLTYFWQPLRRLLGWLFIPLGEASLYVFLMHFVLIAFVDQLPTYFDAVPSFGAVWPVMIWVNTFIYIALIAILWLLVRYRVLFAIIPR